MTEVKAEHWISLDKSNIRCTLCPLYCVIPNGKVGICRFRKNIEGELFLINYGEIAEVAVEPIEKKPLHHYYPSSKVISIGTNGCNMGCTFCQNYEVSQLTYKTKAWQFNDILDLIKKKNAIGVCFTYNEPFVWYEYLRDCATFIKKHGYKVIVNTNGLITKEPLLDILPLIDAINLDIKAFSESFYQKICKAPLEPVLETARTLKRFKKHFEISHLVIPDENDKDAEPLANWILNELGNQIPIHINAYYPRYLMDKPSTPESLIINTCKLFEKIGHKFVYGNNITSEDYKNTNCLNCKQLLIRRTFTSIESTHNNGLCPKCNTFNQIVS